jgi:hypothetical protein
VEEKMSIEAMKMALEYVQEFKRRWWAVPPFGNKVNKVTREAVSAAHSPIFQIEDALRAAIEQYDQTSLELCKECGWRALIPGDGCLVCARQKAKPVAWMYDFLNSDNRDEVIRDWVTQSQDDIKRENGFNVRPLYTAPRQWVELTDDEARALVNRATFGDRTNWQALVYMVDAKLKEKNAA